MRETHAGGAAEISSITAAASSPVPSANRRLDRWCTGLALLLIVALTLRRWAMLGDFPPGLDGAQWIAIGRGFHGVGRSSEGAYSPLVPFLATLADSLLGTLPAIRLLATLSGLVLSLAIWWVARFTLEPMWGLLATAIVIPASALAEPLLYGGYPQQLALAMGILAVTAASIVVATPIAQRTTSTWPLVVLCASALLCAASHHIYFPLMLVSICTPIALGMTASRSLDPWRSLMPLAWAMLPSVALFFVVAGAFVRAGYGAPLDASARSASAAWSYATRESPALWGLLLAVAILSLAATWRNRANPSWLVPASLILPAGLLMMAFGQPRLAPPILIGATLAATFGAHQVSRPVPAIRNLTVMALLAVSALLLVQADRATSTFATFYQVVDASLLRAAMAIENDGVPGTIAVRHDRRGWPIGWWFEALQENPVLSGSDAQWLAFPDERERARQTAALFDGSLGGDAFLAKASETGTRYLVIAKWDWIGWERWLSDPAFPLAVVYDDDRFLVLRVVAPSRRMPITSRQWRSPSRNGRSLLAPNRRR